MGRSPGDSVRAELLRQRHRKSPVGNCRSEDPREPGAVMAGFRFKARNGLSSFY